MLINKSSHIYCLVDCDSFYASCEVLRNPSLAGKAVCVCNEKDIVLASSYEAKRQGVKTWTATRDAKRILGNSAVYIPPDFARYGQVSDKLNDFLSSFTNGTEVFSIDESFCDITGIAELYNLSYEKFAYYLKLKIKKEIGIPVSIGVARTKLLAKLFSDINKPFWEFVALEESEVDSILEKLDMHEVCFLGDARTDKLKWYGMRTAYDVKHADYNKIKKLLWADGLKIRMELNGLDVMTFASPLIPKNITRSRSFHPNFTSNKELLRAHLMMNFEKAYNLMLSHRLSTRYIKVRLRDKEFQSHSQDILLPHYCNEKKELLKHIEQLFTVWFKPRIKYRTTGIILWNLRDTSMYHKDDLFTYHITQAHNKIYSVMNKLNTKFGKIILWTGTEYIINKDKPNTTSLEKTIAFEVG